MISFRITICILVITIAWGGSALADPTWSWGATTSVAWSWDEHESIIIPVKMKLVRWAEIYFADEEVNHIVVEQMPGGYFEGCIDLMVCVNFNGLKIIATYVIETDIADKYEVSLVPTILGSPVYCENETSLTLTTAYLTGNNLPVTLCVRVTGVDQQLTPFGSSADDLFMLGKVNLTLVPTSAPDGVGAGGTFHTSPGQLP